MNREQAKALLPVITAFVEGRSIQVFNGGGVGWVDLKENAAFMANPDNYRIKPEPTYRPFANAVEFTPWRHKWIRFKGSAGSEFVTSYKNNGPYIAGAWRSWQDMLSGFEFEDGSPCGVLVTD